MMDEVRLVAAEMAGVAKQQDRTTTELEGLGRAAPEESIRHHPQHDR
jgi:hypothetical protein